MEDVMKKIVVSLFIAGLLVAVNGCSSDDDSTPTVTGDGVTISSVADDMRKCAPDLASSATVLSQFINGAETDGWSGFATYGVFKKHFDSTSGTESFYATVLMLDEMTTALAEMPDDIFEAEEEGTVTAGDFTIVHASVNSDVTLPTIFSSMTVSDFAKSLTITGSEGESVLYYKPAGDDNTEKIYYKFSMDADNESGAIYAVRNTSTANLTIYAASHKAPGTIPAAGSAHENNEFRCLLYFEGNTTAKTFKFKVKTDAAQGWAFFGGGSIADDSSMIAVRGTDEADDQTYANNGNGFTDDSADSYYVILTFGNMKDSTFTGGAYPKEGIAPNLSGETEDVAHYITLGHADCLFADVAAFKAWKYPEEASELGL